MLPSESNSTPPSGQPTGDLEHLFRQKFAEAEVAPPAGLWEQIDHTLVVGQNETYRRRLGVYRWVAAASVVLLISFGSWFGLRYAHFTAGQTELASRLTLPTATPTPGLRSGQNAPGEATVGAYSAAGKPAAEPLAGVPAPPAPATSAALDLPQEYARPSIPSAAHGAGSLTAQLSSLLNGSAFSTETASAAASPTGVAASGRPVGALGGGQFAFASDEALGGSTGASETGVGRAMAELNGRMATLRSGLSYSRPGTLAQTSLAVAGQAGDQRSEEAKAERAGSSHRWRLLGSYAASAYNPNIDFSRPAVSAVAYTAARPVPYVSPASTTTAAVAEYRQHLRAGLSQRVALTASYTVNKHWALLTGLEAAQQRASSRTSYGFLDSKHTLADASLASIDPSVKSAASSYPRATHYRYRTVGIPVGVRYGTAKAGVSLYAKVGAVMNVLLSSRSELEGSPEATQVYTLNSADSPYRRVQVAARGGVGARFQPANATWSVAVGPSAEVGLTTVNTAPAQPLEHRPRPYAVGIEASVEFGSKSVVALVP